MQTYPPGTRIGQYEIASRPMMGGMGVVYFALDHGNDGRPVALKTFRPELLPNREARDRFLREGTAWIELGTHPHIVRCYKVEYIDPTAFLVLELIAKEQNTPDASLRSWLIPGHPLPIEQALLFALQIARGMQHATEKIPGFVHRDLKPENILVGADKLPGMNINRLRVTDLGLVKTIADSGVSTNTSIAEKLKPNQIQFTRGVGTPLYMAPEQWKGEPVAVFTDAYAFGCILYEMLSGQHAANGKTITELEVSHCEEGLPTTPVDLPDNIAKLIARSCNRDPGLRFGSWNEIIGELEGDYKSRYGYPAPNYFDSKMLSREEQIQAGWSYNEIGRAYREIGKPKVAAGYFEKALVIAREMGNRRGEEVALGNIGLAQSNLGDARQALRYYEQALEIAHELEDRLAETVILSNLGGAYLHLGDSQRALGYQEQALAVARKTGDRHGEGSALNNLGNAYRNLGKIQQAINCYEEYLNISRELGNQRSVGKALGNLGLAYADLGDVQRAIQYYELRLVIAREMGDRPGEEIVINNLGNAYADIGDAGRAIEYYEQSVDLCHELGDRYQEGTTYGNLGTVYLETGDIQRAIQCFERALSIQREIGDANGIATNSLNMANAYAQQRNITYALSLAREAARVFAQIGSPNTEAAQQLVAQLQDGIVPVHSNTLQAAFEAFQLADSLATMQIAVRQFPFMTEDRFFRVVDETIKEQVSLNIRLALLQRLGLLRQIAGR